MHYITVQSLILTWVTLMQVVAFRPVVMATTTIQPQFSSYYTTLHVSLPKVAKWDSGQMQAVIYYLKYPSLPTNLKIPF